MSADLSDPRGINEVIQFSKQIFFHWNGNWGTLPFSPEAGTAQSDALGWEGGKTLLEWSVAWQWAMNPRAVSPKWSLGDANQATLEGDIIHPPFAVTLPRKIQLSIIRPLYLYTCCTLEFLFLVLSACSWIMKFESTGESLEM